VLGSIVGTAVVVVVLLLGLLGRICGGLVAAM
jgi:hypothetical protein